MKKIFLSLSFLIIAATVFAQHPIGNDSFNLQTVANSLGLFKSKGAIASDSGFVNAAYADTSNANLGNKLKNYPGALIRVGNDLWMRNTTATAWIKMNGTGSGGGSGIGAVYAGNCLIQVDDSTLAFDPACAGADSIYLHSSATSDTILYNKNGTSYIAGWIDKGVQSVTGLNTDNTDPLNPIVQISVDGLSITGGGTPADPLVSHSSGTGSTNSNIGSGYRWAVPNTNNIKTVFPGYALTIDSTTNTNALTFKADSATLSAKYFRIVDTTGKWISSVALATPSIFTVSGSPVTNPGGTLTFSPNNATGDIIYGSGTNTLAYRAIGTTGQHLVVSGGLPVWRDTTAVPTSSNFVSSWSGGTTGMTPNTATTGAVTMAGTLGTANGGTNLTSYTTGDLLYASSSSVLSKLSIGTPAQHLTVRAGIPAWVDTAAAGTTYAANNGITLSGTTFQWRGTLNQNSTITGAGFYSAFSGGRLEAGQGAAVAAANDLTLGADGNTFSITGATQINAIAIANWQAGSVVNLIFASTPTVKHNTAGGAGTAVILLSSSADFVAAANDVLTLVYDGTSWHETSRKQAATGGQFWPLTGTGTGIGATNIRYNTPGQLEYTGTATTTANNQYMEYSHRNVTFRNTASDLAYGHFWNDSGTVTANAQIFYQLYLKTGQVISAGSGTGFYALRVGGGITPDVNNTQTVGQNGSAGGGIFLSGAFTTTNTNTVQSMSNAALSIKGGSSALNTLYFHTASGGTKLSYGTSTIDSSYRLNVIGDAKFRGGIVIAPSTTPVATSVTNNGVAGSTTYSYAVVFVSKNGSHSIASNVVTTTTGNATLNGSNFNTINFTGNTEATSEGYLIALYRTAGGASQGLISTGTAFTTTSVVDQGAAGDGTSPPTDNTSPVIGNGVLRPHSNFQNIGSFALSYVAKTGTYSISAQDQTIDCTSGTFTVTLPTAVGITGRKYNIVNSGSGAITIATTSSQTFVNINATPTTLTLAAVGAGAITSYGVMSNGANWIVVEKVKNE